MDKAQGPRIRQKAQSPKPENSDIFETEKKKSEVKKSVHEWAKKNKPEWRQNFSGSSTALPFYTNNEDSPRRSVT